MAESSDDRSGDAVSALWQVAVDEYLKDTDRKRGLGEQSLRGIESAEQLAERIEASSQAFKDFRARYRRLWSTLKQFANPLVTLMKLGGAAGPESIGIPAAVVLSACVYLIEGCQNVTKAYDFIEQVFTELMEFSERLEIYTQNKMDAVLKKKSIGILSFILRVIGRSETLIKGGRFREYLRVTFLGKDEKTKKLVEDLNRLFGSEQRFVVAATYATTQRIEDKLDESTTTVEEKLSKIQGSLEVKTKQEDEEQAEDQLRRALASSSATEDVEDRFFRNRKDMLAGTGDWLSHEPPFIEWLERRSSMLWIFGGPGQGKSYLATWIISRLFEDTGSKMRDKRHVAYFFVKETADILRDANVLLKTLASQLLTQDSEFKAHVIEVTKQRRLTATPEDTWENLFVPYYGRDARKSAFASVVIDGLDEATPSTRRSILKIVTDFIPQPGSSVQPRLQFTLIGRHSLRYELDIVLRERLSIIEVSRAKNEKDIDAYICKRLEEVQVLRELRKLGQQGLVEANKRGAMIRSKVLQGSDGVFLWAKLFIESMLQKDWRQIRLILKEPPRNLDDMIWSVFDRLDRDDELDHVKLRNMLLYTSYAKRPLKFGELDLFLSLPDREPNLLLWKQTRGKLSSVFDVKFPRGKDPDLAARDLYAKKKQPETKGDEEPPTYSDAKEGDPTHAAFDFSGADTNHDGFEDDDDDLDIEDLLHPLVEHVGKSATDGATAPFHHYLSYGQMHTQVTFCHIRIKDFLGLPWRSSTHKKPAFTDLPDSGLAHAEMVIACMDILRLEISLERDSRDLCDYACQFLASHLDEIDESHIPDHRFEQIIEGLHWVLGTDRGAECFLRAEAGNRIFHASETDFMQVWVATDKYLLLFQRWLRRAVETSRFGSLDQDQQNWVRAASTDLKDLLKSWMSAAHNLWLGPGNYESPDTTFHQQLGFFTSHAWALYIDNGNRVAAEMDQFDWYATYELQKQLPQDRVQQVAGRSERPQDCFWHLGVGYKLRETGQYESAIAHLTEAMKDHPHAWKVCEHISLTHEKSGDHTAAIEWQKKAIENLPVEKSWMGGYLWPRISSCAWELDAEDEAFSAAKKGIEAESSSVVAQTWWMLSCYVRTDYKEIMQTVHRMSRESRFQALTPFSSIHHEPWFVPANQLTRWFTRFDRAEVFHAMGIASRHHGETQLVVDAIQEAVQIQIAYENDFIRFLLELMLADFLFRYHPDDVDGAIAALERALQLYPSVTSSFRRRAGVAAEEMEHELAQLCFDQAVAMMQAGSPEKASPYAKKLKTLAVSGNTGFEDYDGFDVYNKTYAASLWGRWLRDYEKAEPRLWRKSFKTRLLEIMGTLDDNDPTNDVEGVYRLSETLLHAGNRQDAAAILAVLFQPLEDRLAREASEPSTEPAEPSDATEPVPIIHGDDPAHEDEVKQNDANNDAGNDAWTDPAPSKPNLNITADDVLFYCDNCSRRPFETKEFHLCEVCYDTAFCGGCLAIIQQEPHLHPRPRQTFCNRVHPKYQVWPIPEEARGLAARYIGDTIQLRSEWLGRLRDEWLGAAV